MFTRRQAATPLTSDFRLAYRLTGLRAYGHTGLRAYGRTGVWAALTARQVLVLPTGASAQSRAGAARRSAPLPALAHDSALLSGLSRWRQPPSPSGGEDPGLCSGGQRSMAAHAPSRDCTAQSTRSDRRMGRPHLHRPPEDCPGRREGPPAYARHQDQARRTGAVDGAAPG